MKKIKDILINWDQENLARLIASYEQYMCFYRHIECISENMMDGLDSYNIKTLLEEIIDININEDKYLDFYEYFNCSFEKIMRIQNDYLECDYLWPDRVDKLAERLLTPYKKKRKLKILGFDYRSIFRKEINPKKKQFISIFMLNWLGYEINRLYRTFDDMGFSLYGGTNYILSDCALSVFDSYENKDYEYSVEEILPLLHCPFYFQESRLEKQEMLLDFIHHIKSNENERLDDEINQRIIARHQKEIDILPDCSTFDFDKIERNCENGKKYAWLFDDAITICEKSFNWTESYDTYLTWCEEIIDAQNNIPLYKYIYEKVFDERRNFYTNKCKEQIFCGYGNSLLSNDSGEENFDYMAMNAKIKKELKAILKKKKAEK